MRPVEIGALMALFMALVAIVLLAQPVRAQQAPRLPPAAQEHPPLPPEAQGIPVIPLPRQQAPQETRCWWVGRTWTCQTF